MRLRISLAAGAALALGAAACDRVPDRGVGPPPEAGGMVDQAGDPTLAGRWAPEPALCDTRAWAVTETQFVTDAGLRCTLESLGATSTGWVGTARCTTGPEGVVELNTADTQPHTLVVTGGPFTSPVTLVRCPGPLVPAEAPQRDPHQFLEAARQVDQRIARQGSGIVQESFEYNALLARVFREDGEIVKLVEPIVGGDHAGAERAYYFRPNQSYPFLVSDPDGHLAFVNGRLVTAYSVEGEIQPPIRTPDLEEREGRLLRQAEVLRSVAAGVDPIPEDAPGGRN